MGAQLSRKLTFIAFFHLYTCFNLHSICALHWSCSDEFRITPQTAVSLTTQLSHNQAMPSLMSQQFNTLFTTHTTGPHSEETETHKVGILKFILILLSSLYLSLQNSIDPSCFLPTILASLISPCTVCQLYEAAWLHCCFHLTLEEQLKVQTDIFQAHRPVAKHPAQPWRPPKILSSGHQRSLPRR